MGKPMVRKDSTQPVHSVREGGEFFFKREKHDLLTNTHKRCLFLADLRWCQLTIRNSFVLLFRLQNCILHPGLLSCRNAHVPALVPDTGLFPAWFMVLNTAASRVAQAACRLPVFSRRTLFWRTGD